MNIDDYMNFDDMNIFDHMVDSDGWIDASLDDMPELPDDLNEMEELEEHERMVAAPAPRIEHRDWDEPQQDLSEEDINKMLLDNHLFEGEFDA